LGAIEPVAGPAFAATVSPEAALLLKFLLTEREPDGIYRPFRGFL
jgi:hypothetical protein